MNLLQTCSLLLAAFLVVVASAGALTAEAGPSVSGRVIESPSGKGVADVPVELWSHRGTSSPTTKTDAQGRYTFLDVVPDRYTLHVEDYQAGRWTEGIIVEVKGDPVRVEDLPLLREQSVAGRVTDIETGKGVPGVTMHFNTADRNWDATTTDAQGEYRIDTNAREIKLECQGTQDRYIPIEVARSLLLADGQHLGDINFQVHSAKMFRGRIVHPDGSPAKGVEVLAFATWGTLSEEQRNRVEEAKKRREERIAKGLEKRPAEPQESGLRGGFGSLMSTQEFHFRTDEKGEFRGYLRRPMYYHGPAVDAIDVICTCRSTDRSRAGMGTILTTSIDPAPEPTVIRLVQTATAELCFVDPDGDPILSAEPDQSILRSNIYHSYPYPNIAAHFEDLGKGRFRATGLVPGWGYSFFGRAPGHRDSLRGEVIWPKAGDDLALGDAVISWGGKHAVPELIGKLMSHDMYDRESGCHEIGTVGADAAEAVPELIRLLRDDPSNSVRYSAAEALGNIGPAAKAAFPQLLTALRKDAHGVPREAARALGRLGEPRAVPALVAALESEELDVRVNAATALGQFGTGARPAVSKLVRTLQTDEHYLVRQAAARSLTRLGCHAEDAAPALLRAVKAESREDVRLEAIRALGAIGDPSTAPKLRAMLKQASPDEYRVTTEALRQLEESR